MIPLDEPPATYSVSVARRADEPRAPVHDRVYDELRQGLVDGRLVPGRPLTLRGLAAMLGVSPMPVRAAVTRLVAEGALALTPTRRVGVPAMTRARFDELVCVRLLLEGEAAARALPAIDAERLALIRAHDRRLEDRLSAGDVQGYMAANHAFHFAIYRAAPSEVLIPMIGALWLQFGPFMRLVYDGLDMATLIDQHERAIAAIVRRDAAALKIAIEADIAEGMGHIGKSVL